MIHIDTEDMNDEIQSYAFLELIKSILFIFLILDVYDFYAIYLSFIKPMKFRLNPLYISIELFTFIWRN